MKVYLDARAKAKLWTKVAYEEWFPQIYKDTHQMGSEGARLFVPPNKPERLGRWSGRYAADYDFITSTLAKYPEGQSAVVWEQAITVRQGYHGEGHGIVIP